MQADRLNNKILVVDDNPKNIQVLGSILQKQNYKVGFALNGQEALDILYNKSDYDLILLDINMPVMDGYETCSNIRKNDKFSNIPIIFLTALKETDDMLKGFEIGGQDYITKPFITGELLARVKTHLELKEAKDKLININTILEEKVAERTKDLLEANKKLESLDIEKTEFLRLISHEINTPLNGIMGFTDILKSELETNEEFVELIDALDSSAKRLEKFANVGLHITRIRTMSEPPQKENISIKLLMDSTEVKLKNSIKEKGINIKYSNIVDKSIFGNPEYLELCIEAILKNAIDFSNSGDTIFIETEERDHFLILSVKDQGIGFKEKSLKKLFKLFSTQGSHIDNNKGLDLALAKMIIDLHNGRIEINNNKDKGATVTLYFPTDS